VNDLQVRLLVPAADVVGLTDPAALQDLGFGGATDVIGGYQAWQATA